jgi:hypothetical protein
MNGPDPRQTTARRPRRPWLALGLLVAGCAGGYDSLTALRNSVDEFHDGFRWGAMGSMLPHVRVEDQDASTTDYQARMDGVSIADYEVSRIQLADDSDSADVWVRLSWYRADEMLVHEATIREHWVSAGATWNRVDLAVERGELPDLPASETGGLPPLTEGP